MKILCIGDIVGKPGRMAVAALLPELTADYGLDCVIANAENSAGGAGVTSRVAKHLFRVGVTGITLGDHAWDQKEVIPYMKDESRMIRPANFPEGAPGIGSTVVTAISGQKVGIINLLGRTFMRYNVDCPFKTFSKIYDRLKEQTPIVVVDLHAETTSEKVAFGFYADGRATAVVGTHTHIQTADEKILPNGTAYITDMGMTGPYDSVIGQDKERIIERFLTSMPNRFHVAEKDVVLHGVVVTVDDQTGRATKIERIQRALTDQEGDGQSSGPADEDKSSQDGT